MRKQKRRPSPERHDRKEQLRTDEELNEVWEVLATTRRSSSWHLPWRDGRNAIRLALKHYEASAGVDVAPFEFVQSWLAGEVMREPYWQAQEWLTQLGARPWLSGERILVAALRMAQIMIADSSGGGENYNAILQTMIDSVDDAILRVERCRDALGIDPGFDQSPRDKLRRAFYTAWDRGLYDVAYAVGQAKDL